MDEPIELLTNAEMTATDAKAAAMGLSIDRLMERAGKAVAARAASLFSPGGRILVLCGPGNNGGDGYVAGRFLRERGLPVSVFAAHPPESGGAAARAADAWREAGGHIAPFAEFDPQAGDCVIDALYGAGLSRPIAGAAAELIENLNAARAAMPALRVLAVDVPSGLSGDSGQPNGPCLAADETVTFFRLKPGHLLWPGRALCGAITRTEIGLSDGHRPNGAGQICVNLPGLWKNAVPHPDLDTHKYKRGHCLVVSGSEFQTGASRLSAIAALKGGAGAVTLAGEAAALRVHASHVTAIMLHPLVEAADLKAWLRMKRPASAVIGPAAGVDDATLGRLHALLDAAIPSVLDADALTLLAGRHDLLAKRIDPAAPIVLTPHAGEFARLFPNLDQDQLYRELSADLRCSKLEKARAAARLVKGIVVFKGIDTVIAAPDGRAAININAGPELATAGSGDVLAGLIGAHLAQAMPAFEAAAAAVWLHAAIGVKLGIGLTAEDLAAGIKPLSLVLEAKKPAPFARH